MESVISILYSVIAFVIALGILVFIHEFGHFLMARLSGMRVNTFALGMGFRLFGWNRVNGFSFGRLPEDLDLQEHCDYRLASFPIGGYCQIAGMVDETFDKTLLDTEPHPWEYRAKGPIKQALVTAGGVLFNILLAIVFFAIVIFNVGSIDYRTTTIADVSPNSICSSFGFKSGDKIISINKFVPETWNELVQAFSIDNMGKDLYIKVNRNGIDTILFVDGKDLLTKLTAEVPIGIEPTGLKTIVDEVMPDGLAKENGINNGDTIIAVNGETIYSHQGLISILQANKNKDISISVKNQAGIIDKQFTLNNEGTLGIRISSTFEDIDRINYNIFQSIWKGTLQTFETFKTIVLSIKQIIIGNMSFKSAIGGPVMIAKYAGEVAERGILTFINFTAMLSVSLALINILPFPGLDGGHLVIIIIEAIIRRELPIKAKLAIQQVGMVCLLMLMAYVIFNDILKLM
jgi:regulator of sigma E protease